ncbi:MAG: efflux RND transporter periplasmic adaptor subunit [Candidatus Kryptoniota bacterium]
MKRLKVYSVVALAFALIVAVLLRNRAQIKAETNNLNQSSYAVGTAVVGKEDIRDDLDLVGTINANNDVHVVSEASGKVVNVFAGVGDHEPAGGPIVQLDYKLQAAALQLAKVSLEKAVKDYKRYQQLYQEHSVTDAQLESAELAYQSANDQFVVAQRQYNNTRITSPISGIVSSRAVDLGDYVTPGMVVAEVVDISKLKVTISVAEQSIMGLKAGAKATISSDVYPGVDFSGFIKSISSKADADHTYPVEVDFPNSREHPLKAGMFADVRFMDHTVEDHLVIPRQALVGSVQNAHVFVVKDGIATLRNIVIGSAYNDYLEVLSGLEAGESVVTSGQDNLENNYKVEVIN